MEVAALQLPPGSVLRDLAWYKDGQLALILQKAGKPMHLSELHLVVTAGLEYASVPLMDGTTALQARYICPNTMGEHCGSWTINACRFIYRIW